LNILRHACFAVVRQNKKQKQNKEQKKPRSMAGFGRNYPLRLFLPDNLCRYHAYRGVGFYMPSGLDWRSAAAHAYLDNLSGSEFAWEFLRRNPDYRRDHRTIIGDPAQPAEFRELLILRWGLPFRDRSGSAG
jgi:Family of unknown function (DUF6499)